jgi:hypothetical protein
MRTWEIARFAETCGSCADPIGQGELFLSMKLPNVKRPRVYCVPCAEMLLGEVPPDHPPHPEPPPPREPAPPLPANVQRQARLLSMRRLERIARPVKPKPFSKVHDGRDGKALAIGE